MFLDFLYAFGIGISFFLGILAGSTLTVLVTKKGRQEVSEEWKKHTKVIEDKLSLLVLGIEKIADRRGVL